MTGCRRLNGFYKTLWRMNMSVEYKQEFQVDNVSNPMKREVFDENDMRHFQEDGQPENEIHEEPEIEEEAFEEEQPEEESVEASGEEQKKRQKRDPANARINQLQRQRYAALHESERLRDENERLKRLATLTTDIATKHYEESISQRMQQAITLKKQAVESGDVEAQAKAETDYLDAMIDYKTHNTSKAREALQAQEAAYQGPSHTVGPIVNEREARSWIERNPWANPNTEDYDAQLFQLADSAASQLDLYCYQNGNQHLIQSPEYFRELDNYVNQARQSMESQRAQSHGRSQIPMRQSTRSPVMPVRGSNNAQSSGRQKIQLNSAQKEMARSLGVTDEAYAKDFKEKYTRMGG
jgi:hypothetical protein